MTSHHHLTLKRCSSDTLISKIEDKPSSNLLLPAKKKPKNERGTIMSFFNNKKNEKKENKSRSRSKSNKKLKSQRVKENEQKSYNPTDNGFLSNVHVEKTSLILFDEVCIYLTLENHRFS